MRDEMSEIIITIDPTYRYNVRAFQSNCHIDEARYILLGYVGLGSEQHWYACTRTSLLAR